MNVKIFSVGSLIMISTLVINAQTSDNTPKFRRSSIYSIMVHSNATDTKLKEADEAAANSNVIKGLIKSASKSAGSDSSKVDPVVVRDLFPTIAIPQQFNDFNLSTRVIEFDNYTITDDDIKAADEADGTKKKKGFGGLASKAMGAVGMDMSKLPAMPGTDDVTKGMKALALKFFKEENTAANLVAKWYNYSDAEKEGSHYDMATINDKGIYSISAEDKRKFEASGEANSKITDDAVNLIGHTYVMFNYFKYRSNAAIIAELQAYADLVGSQVGGAIGIAASQAAGLAASTIAGDGYSVQTNTYLYRLDWTDEANNTFYEKYWNGSLEDLINSGICKLTYVGKEKSRAGVRVGAFSKVNYNDLLKRAVLRSLDENIARLQVSFEDFRTLTPILGVDAKAGEIYAEIGLRENLDPKDEYEVLQPIEGSDGTITYKSVGKFKPVEGKIYDNREGAAEEIAEDLQSTDTKVKEAAEKVSGLTKSTFAGGKVKEEYAGCFLRLTKKAKGKNK